MVLFNFPPNGGSTGTAAYLSVFASLHNTLRAMRDGGYEVEVPASVDALRAAILQGNAAQYGTEANVGARIELNDHVKRETWLAEIESQWGPAPGKQQSDGRGILVLGARFGNVFVGIQPAFGYEGDPDAPAVRRQLCADACLFRLLSLAARGFRGACGCCISAPTARSSSCPASRPGCRGRAGLTA